VSVELDRRPSVEAAIFADLEAKHGPFSVSDLSIARPLARLMAVDHDADIKETIQRLDAIDRLKARLPPKPAAAPDERWRLDWLDDRALAVLEALHDLAHAATPADLSEEAVAVLRSVGCGRKPLSADNHRDLSDDEFAVAIAAQDAWTAVLGKYEPPVDLVEENAESVVRDSSRSGSLPLSAVNFPGRAEAPTRGTGGRHRWAVIC
jgi:hypothetical protein